jgi:serine/threonine protein kinase
MTGHELLVDRYQLLGLLGSGGMAEVRDGWDTRLDRPVAIKLMHAVLKAQPDIRRRFEHEARAAANLSHPNIVAVHDFGEQDGTPFIVMERLPGRTLADLIARGPMPPERVRAMLNDVLAALTVAHAAGVLHRDIKPGNILVSATGDSLKVADFGIAKTGGAAHTMTGQIVGTMAYLSPERVAGAPASVADDLYAVGVIAYEAVLARRAFPHDTPIALARAIMDNPPPPLSAVRPDLDPILSGLIDRAMTRDARQRFGSAAQMRAALAGDRNALFAGAAPVLVAAPRPATKVLPQPLAPSATYFVPASTRRRLSGRARMGLAAAAVLVAFTIAALAVAMDTSSTTKPPEPVSTSTSVPTPTSKAPPLPPVAPVVEPEKKKDRNDGDDERGGNRGRGGGD